MNETSRDPRIRDLALVARRAGFTTSTVKAGRARAKIDLVASRVYSHDRALVRDYWERIEVNVDSFNGTIYAVRLLAGRYVSDVRGVEAVEALLLAPVPAEATP